MSLSQCHVPFIPSLPSFYSLSNQKRSSKSGAGNKLQGFGGHLFQKVIVLAFTASTVSLCISVVIVTAKPLVKSAALDLVLFFFTPHATSLVWHHIPRVKGMYTCSQLMDSLLMLRWLATVDSFHPRRPKSDYLVFVSHILKKILLSKGNWKKK